MNANEREFNNTVYLVVKEQDRATNKYGPAAPGGKTHIRRTEGEKSIANICFVFNVL